MILYRYRNALLFITLQLFSFYLTIRYSQSHKAIWYEYTGNIIGIFHDYYESIYSYFDLQDQNRHLIRENEQLKNQLLKKSKEYESLILFKDTIWNDQYKFISTKVVKSTYKKRDNTIILKGGHNQGFKKNMGVVSANGVIGIIEQVSDNYSRVLPMINPFSKINARLKNSRNFGYISWNGKDFLTVQLNDLPKQAMINKNDTIVTDTYSAIFPEGIPIGIISKIYPSRQAAFYIADIKLFEDFSNLNRVYVVFNKKRKEFQTIVNGNKR